ncbi:MAG: SUMF1/EgtB/PvdO family nonheme iron enzyme [Myxococcales bacterium]|nr:SUMF1/EgtB/PvdO family nonheme iron enzyme [Myxococcales bacterium]
MTALLTGCPDLHRPFDPPDPPEGEPEPEAPPTVTPPPTLGQRCDAIHQPDGSCTAGLHGCAVGGPLVCVGGVVVCSATARPSAAEQCSATPDDEDCDGRIDEGLRCCADGRTATEEKCNGIDDDCDGTVDEGLGLGEACEGMVGACTRPGERRCAPDGTTTCQPFDDTVGVEDGRCDGVDDDCNGRMDDAPPCNGAPIGSEVVQPGFDALGLPDHPWVLIAPLQYTRGSDDERAFAYEGPAHPVQLTQTVMVASNEVTIAEWRAITGSEPPALHADCDDCPVERVSWYEAVRFANLVTAWRRQVEPDLTDCYVLRACAAEEEFGRACPDNGEYQYRCNGLYRCEVEAVSECTGYRLLTEAEWEAAARAGSQSLYWFGEDGAQLQSHENCGQPENDTEPVSARLPNAFGLVHMLGNVGEWVFDTAGDYPVPPPETPWVDPIADEPGPDAGVGPERVYRGHSPHAIVDLCHSTSRRSRRPVVKDYEMGLRLARTLVPKPIVGD